MKNLLLFIALIGLLFSSCAQSILVTYSHEAENNSTLIIKPSKAVEKTSLTVNDQLLVESKNVKKITVNKLPEGENKFHITSESNWLKSNFDVEQSVELKNGTTKTVLLPVPPYNGAYYALLTGLIALDVVLLLVLL